MSQSYRIKLWDALCHPCPNFNGGLIKPPLKLGHGWVITSHMKQWMLLFVSLLSLARYCNCHEYGTDEGYLQDIHRFPIKTLVFGDTDSSSEWMYYELGPLKCIMGTTICKIIPDLYQNYMYREAAFVITDILSYHLVYHANYQPIFAVDQQPRKTLCSDHGQDRLAVIKNWMLILIVYVMLCFHSVFRHQRHQPLRAYTLISSSAKYTCLRSPSSSRVAARLLYRYEECVAVIGWLIFSRIL